MLALNLYNKLALITGFPEYTNDTDAPETTRFLLDCLSEGLHSVINNIYMQNNVLERTDTITTKDGIDTYGIEGIIKSILVQDGARVRKLRYMDDINPNYILEGEGKVRKEPEFYTIQKGYLRVFPTPDREYKMQVTVSTTDLVWANDDSSRNTIEDINDALMADNRFCKLVVMRAATIIFARAQNAMAQVYQDLYSDELRDYLEHDLKTFEANRFFDRSAGHFNPERGLLG